MMKHFLLTGSLAVGVMGTAWAQQARKGKATHQTQVSSLKDACALSSGPGVKASRTNTLFLLVAGGISPTVYPSDTAFEHRFHVQYLIGGCMPVMVCGSAFNNQIFDYLQTAYGNAWQSTVRKDVIGLQEWEQRY